MYANVKLTKLAISYAFIVFANFKFIHGQTPRNYIPSTLNTLNISFNGNPPIHPGQSLQPSGMTTFL